MADNSIKRLIDAGVEFTGVSQAKAESLVRKWVRDGEVRRRDAERVVSALVGKGKETAEGLVVTVQRELSVQLDRLSSRLDEVEQRVEDVVSRIASSTGLAPSAATKKAAPAKKAAATKKAPAKKAGAKKVAPAKKAAPAKKKAAAKKAATGPSGVRRVSARRS